MNWIQVNSIEEINSEVAKQGINQYIVFKHSTRCSISSMAKSRFERLFPESLKSIPVFLVLVIESRPLSNFLEQLSGIQHQSPQMLVFSQDTCVFHQSHNSIHPQDAEPFLIKS